MRKLLLLFLALIVFTSPHAFGAINDVREKVLLPDGARIVLPPPPKVEDVFPNSHNPPPQEQPVTYLKLDCSYKKGALTDELFRSRIGNPLTISQKNNVSSITLKKQICITNKTLSLITPIFTQLTSINLSHCGKISSADVLELVKGCQLLKRIDLSGCPLITDQALASIAEFCPYLEVLLLHDCSNISDKGINNLARNCTHLKVLDIGGTPKQVNISGESLDEIAENCFALQQLIITGCTKIKPGDIRRFQSKLPQCKIIGPEHPAPLKK
ncbi:MAG: hypothetical protein WCT20_00110 [Candidatus Babeliales bacterium]|jgi:hypothetical protein